MNPNLLRRKILVLSYALFCGFGWIFLLEGADKLHYTHATVITPQGVHIDVEVADTEAKRRLGLSFRKELQPRKGMLFIFDYRDKHPFWMKDMLIPIDILWLDNHRIVHLEHSASPPPPNQTPPTIVPDKKANFVLELAAGQAKELNLRVGQKLQYRF